MLRSLIDQLSTAAESSSIRQVLQLPVEAIDPDPEQPRKTFEDLGDLTASIRAIGIKQPLLVRPRSEQPDRYLLIAGERRLRAATSAGLSSVPCLIDTEDAEDPGRRLITQLSENLQREDLPILEAARAIERALDISGLSKGELANLIGKNRAFISKHLALLKAEGAALEALEEGLLVSTETFRLFKGLPPENQRTLLGKARSSGQPIARAQADKPASSSQAKDVRERRTAEPDEAMIHFKLSPDEVRRIIERFGVEPPSNASELKPFLRSLLQ
ncbi:MAG: ParB/RepB/Spo0J family partition protein [bacterium]|nr:ParB/RepB/Spo0J family partition protein [bacterium]